MAIGDPYATVDELKAYMGITDDADDDLIASALASVSQEIEDMCGRQFNTDTGSTRVFTPVGRGLVLVDDFYTATDLVVVVDGTTWTDTDYVLYPLNGLRNGRPWPYGYLIPTRRALPCGWPSVSITPAGWGWSEVPAPVHESSKIATSETFALKDARFGVAGYGADGVLRVRDNPMVASKLAPYMLNPVLVG